MITMAVVAFLLAHGWVHVAIYMPKPAADGTAPFDPGHSWLLGDVGVAALPQRQAGTTIAWMTAILYSVAALAILATGGWVPALAIAAAAVGLVLKCCWFHRWLLLGIALDLAVVWAALVGWPSALSG